MNCLVKIVYLYFIKKRINAIPQFIVKTIILFKNNDLATLLYEAISKIKAIELRLYNLGCGYSLIVRKY